MNNQDDNLTSDPPSALLRAACTGTSVVSESETRSDCIKSSFLNNKCNLYLGMIGARGNDMT